MNRCIYYQITPPSSRWREVVFLARENRRLRAVNLLLFFKIPLQPFSAVSSLPLLLPNTLWVSLWSHRWVGSSCALQWALAFPAALLCWRHLCISAEHERVVRKGKAMCVSLPVQMMELSVDDVTVPCLLFIFSHSLWWSNTPRLQINLSAEP